MLPLCSATHLHNGTIVCSLMTQFTLRSDIIPYNSKCLLTTSNFLFSSILSKTIPNHVNNRIWNHMLDTGESITVYQDATLSFLSFFFLHYIQQRTCSSVNYMHISHGRLQFPDCERLRDCQKPRAEKSWSTTSHHDKSNLHELPLWYKVKWSFLN